LYNIHFHANNSLLFNSISTDFKYILAQRVQLSEMNGEEKKKNSLSKCQSFLADTTELLTCDTSCHHMTT